METPNPVALSRQLKGLGMDERAIERIYRTYNANAPGFREESERHGT
jgi:hypothetical protein